MRANGRQLCQVDDGTTCYWPGQFAAHPILVLTIQPLAEAVVIKVVVREALELANDIVLREPVVGFGRVVWSMSVIKQHSSDCLGAGI